MRLLVISNALPPTVFGGYEHAAADIVKAAEARGWNVKVVCSNWALNSSDAPLDAERVLRWHFPAESPTARASVSHPSIVDGNAASIDAVLTAFQPDRVLLLNLAGLGIGSVLAPVCAASVPTIAYLMDSWPCIDEIQRLGGGDWLTAPLLQFAPIRWIACSRTLAREVEHRSSGAVSVSDLVPAWIELSVQASSGGARSPRVPSFAFVSSLHAAKGALATLEAFTKIATQFPNSELHFYGDGPEKAELARRVNLLDSQIGAAVHMHGWLSREEARSQLGNHTALVFPTWSREPFGFVILEAMALGIPVITTKHGGTESMPEGTYIRCTQEPVTIAKAMRRVLIDPSGASQVALKAHRMVLDEYSSLRLQELLDRIEEHDGGSAPGKHHGYFNTWEALVMWLDDQRLPPLHASRAVRLGLKVSRTFPAPLRRRLRPLAPLGYRVLSGWRRGRS